MSTMNIMSTKMTQRLPCLLMALLLLVALPEAAALQPSRLFSSSRDGTSKIHRDQGMVAISGVIRRYRGGSFATSPVLSTTSFVNPQDEVAEETYDNEEYPYSIPMDASLTNNPGIQTSHVPDTDWGQKEDDVDGTKREWWWWRYIVPSRSMLPELVAEGFGTFILLQMALGIVASAVITQSMEGVFPIAVLTGGAITAAVAVVSSKCAAHFNPAITWAMCLYRKFGWTKFIPYSVSQLMGATLAAAVNFGMYAGHIKQFEATRGIVRASMDGVTTAKMTACYYATPLVSPVTAFLAEAFGTFVLSSVIFALTSEKNKQVKGLFIPPIIGATVALIITIVGPISCASLNPARELGPRLVLKAFGWSTAAFHQLGLYMLAPLVGATLGGFFVEKFLYSNVTSENVVMEEEGALKDELAFQ